MGYRLRRWFEDRLPQEISSGERVVALAIADLVWDDSRIGYGNKFMAKLLWKTGFESEAQITKVLSKLAGRGIELRVPISGADGKPLTNKRGQFVYAHRGHQRTFRVPLESEFPFRSAPYWDEEEERSADVDPRAWYDGERPPARGANAQERVPARGPNARERVPARGGNEAERVPARESKGPRAGTPIPLTTTTYLPPTAAPDSTTPHEPAGAERDEELAAAVDFLMNLPAPWAVGRVTAKANAPLLLEAITEQGWHLDEQLAAKLTENPNGINRHSSVLRIRIGDLPKAPQQTPRSGPTLPRWCGQCGDGNPAAEFNAKFRTAPGSSKPCPDCHPDTHAADAA
ncbi:hypothetical protein [Streptomyces scabiei]|uniref:hypothetical protein n=1 Tax=Streptomyces scabiei TaxID=1930 RepID=UPI0038F5ED0E